MLRNIPDSRSEGRRPWGGGIFFFAVASVVLIMTLPRPVYAASDCFTCHGDPARSKAQVAKDKFAASVHGQAEIGCTDCHSDADAGEMKHADTLKKVSCVPCHDDVAKKHPFHPAMAKESEAIACQDCHGSHEVGAVKERRDALLAACGDCHPDEVEEYSSSAHARAAKEGQKGAPNCLLCHARALVTALPDTPATSLKIEQEKLCLSCHLDKPEVRAAVGPSAGFIAAYDSSVHGRALATGNANAPNCVSCHGAHRIARGAEADSMVNRSHIAENCGKCHTSIAVAFAGSIHGEAVKKQLKDAPTCTTCHGEHGILKHDDPQSPVAPSNVSAQVCTPCHNSLRLSEKYGIKSDRFQTFDSSFHGLAVKAGSLEVANCASCHGAHDILPSSNPKSSIARENLPKTCGACHPGANERFTSGSIHVTESRAEHPLLYWISRTYILLIVLLVGGMFAHNVLDFVKKSRRVIAVRRGLIEESGASSRLYLRMNLQERLQHFSLLLSFLLLVLTGFMLRYPDAWWAAEVYALSPMAFDLRSDLHRFAGALMCVAGVYHLLYVAFTQRGRELIMDLWPTFQDGIDAYQVLKYNLGLSSRKPRFGRFGYVEKSEYWALIWGCVVMALTGFIMWFDNTFMGILGKLGYDVSRTIHFYEACLAALSIVVWHFYFVIFNPDVYPMNLAWLTGWLSEKEMEDEHPLELEEIHGREPSHEGDSKREGEGAK